MRNLFSSKYMYLTAAMLTGAAMFTSCSNEDDMGNVNPTYDGESVKTQFAINIPYGKTDTRMSEDATQGDGASATFNGMQNIYIIPLNTTGSSSSTFTNIIPLTSFSTFDGKSSNYKLYNDVNVPVGTTHFLFYAMGGTTIPNDATGKFTNGILQSTLPTTASAADVKFNLEKILTGTEFTTPQTTLLKILNGVANVADWNTQIAGTTLGDLYIEYKKLKAGSANSILLTMQELYNAVNELATAQTSSTEKTIAEAIQNKIKESFTPSQGNAPYTLTWTTENNYPTDLNVPEGAAQVTWDNSAFKYVDPASVGTGDNKLNVNNLCYPASLAYFVNTPLKATAATNVTWPSTAAAWETGTEFQNWQSTVSASTRTVALEENIQYGVANLKTTVKCKTATLEDNANEVAGLAANQQVVVPADGFPVTGLLVGGQPDYAEWDMTPVSNAYYTQTVYDNSLTSINAKYDNTGSTTSSPNYTLLLDNTDNTTKQVNIALELTNNSGTDFYGVDGKIAKGAKFYLVARLDPTSASGVTQPSGETMNDVFVKDHITEANLTIASLKNAYVTIPDLRASELVLGLSVDLTWETGIKFDVEIQ